MTEGDGELHLVQAEPYRQGTVPPFGSPLTSQGCIKTQPGRVQALPNLQGFVPAPGIVEGSVRVIEGEEGGAGAAEEGVDVEGEVFCAFET